MATRPTDPKQPTLQPSLDEEDRARRARRHRRRHIVRWIKRGGLLVIAAAAAALVVRSWMPKPTMIDAGPVARGALEVFVEEDGRTRVRERYVVSAPLGGNLLRIELEPGDAVEAGAIVARVVPAEPALLDRRTQAEVEARLSAAIAHARQADASAARAQAAMELAQREAARARGLAQRDAISAAELDRAVLQERLSVEERSVAELQKRVAAAEVATARAALGSLRRGDTAAFEITAPAAGRVLRVLRESAGLVAPGTPLLELGDPSRIEVVVDVLSSDAVQIAPGAAVAVERWGGEAPLRGRVRKVEPSAYTRVSALGVEEQRVDVVVSLDEAPPALGDGYRVEARIELWRGEDVVTAPASAVFRHEGGWAVFRVVDGHAHLQPVELGHRGRAAVEIRGGLAPGDEVVLYPGDRVSDGAAIERRAATGG